MSETTTASNGAWRERLTELLASQRSAVSQLSELAQQQAGYIREGRSDALLALLARRQELIDGFLATHTDMQSLLTDIGEQIEQLSAEDRGSIREMIEEINTLLGEVLQRDDADRVLLEESRQGVQKELASITSGRQARNAYLGGGAAGNSRFADQQG